MPLVVYSLKEIFRGRKCLTVSVCRAQHGRNPTLLEEPLWDHNNSNNNPLPGILIHTQVGWSVCLSRGGRQAHRPKQHTQCLWGIPGLAIAVRWVMLRFSLLLEQQQGDATCHLQACEALLPTVFTRYSGSTWLAGAEHCFTLWGSWQPQCLLTHSITLCLCDDFFSFFLSLSISLSFF